MGEKSRKVRQSRGKKEDPGGKGGSKKHRRVRTEDTSPPWDHKESHGSEPEEKKWMYSSQTLLA